MTCVLRVFGATLSIDDLLKLIPLQPSAIWRAGEARLSPKTLNMPSHQDSGFNVTVSDRGMDDLFGQIEDAIGFLRSRDTMMNKLMNYPGVENLELDFGLARRDGGAMISIHLPLNLISEACKFRLSLTISQYETSE
jgi:hypothetical protein